MLRWYARVDGMQPALFLHDTPYDYVAHNAPSDCQRQSMVLLVYVNQCAHICVVVWMRENTIQRLLCDERACCGCR
jgi:hypothetical protein